MKDELKRVLNYKLGDINGDIESLNELNTKINEVEEKSNFVTGILDIFKDQSGNNPLNFAKLSKEDFDRVIELVGDEVKAAFNSESCNYDGLVYLINGINNGVSLTLTDEQRNNIDKLIAELDEKRNQFGSAIDGYALVKSRYDISDLDVLGEKKNSYEEILNDVDNGNYVKDTDLLIDAIKFSSLPPEKIINLLTYVLEYNADVFKNYQPPKVEEEKPVEVEETEIKTEPPKEEDIDFHFNQISNDDLFELPNISFDEKEEEKVEDEVKEETNDEINEYMPDYQEYPPHEDVTIPEEVAYIPAMEETYEKVEDNVTLDTPAEVSIDNLTEEENEVTIPEEIPEEVSEEAELPEEETTSEVDEDFKDVIDNRMDYDESTSSEEEKKSTRELQKIFGKYGIEENTVLNELIDGDISEYQKTLDLLEHNKVLEYFRPNKELLVETLLYSNSDVIEKVLKIVREDLSVDDEDYGITLKIVINTIPSIFVKEGGNYDNFVKNVELYKEIGLNLINLFDFSKEVFIADNDSVAKNVDIINKYGFDINYKNAKYFFLIPNIADRLDYYIESVYEDKLKKETFDGINYIKDYAAKLNVVTDTTIKRLRYSSENGKKVFGSKPGSLSGEITNLKVNALDISDEYMNKFFDNEFANLTGDEVREYIKLVHNSSNVGDYSDELDKLNSYHDGLRYNIEGINVSYNKVVRNYSILRSYGIDSKKALQFAVCYNLVITKDEYDKLNNLLDKIGGNI